MKCPNEIQEHLLAILEMGVLNIRFLLDKKDYDLSRIEANHIHNLPNLISHFSYERLAYYLNVESIQYMKEMGDFVCEDYKKVLGALGLQLAG